MYLSLQHVPNDGEAEKRQHIYDTSSAVKVNIPNRIQFTDTTDSEPPRLHVVLQPLTSLLLTDS